MNARAFRWPATSSRSRFARQPLEYRGHVVHEGRKLKMSDFVPELKKLGHTVVAAKLTRAAVGSRG